MNQTVIELVDVHKEYTIHNAAGGGYKLWLTRFLQGKALERHTHKVLRGISFSVRQGECIGIVGKNGAGKSTLLGMLANVIKPTTGRIDIRRKVFAMLELGSGFHPDLTGRENILLNGVILGLRRREVQAQLKNIIEFSELGDFIDQPIRTYSSGMLARLGFSILVQLWPQILLLDEVFAVGDVRFQEKCRQALFRLKERKDVTIVMVSHDMPSVLSLCERVIWIENGLVRMDADAASVAAEYCRCMEEA